MRKIPISVVFGLLAMSAILSACATDPAKAAAKKKEDDGYVWVYPTGSHIAVRVPKDQANSSAQQTAQDQAALSNVLSRTHTTPSTNK